MNARMPLRDAMDVLHTACGNDDIVVTTMGAAREWIALGARPLDLVFVPSSMGHATSVGLGLALAQPRRRVIVVNGDGSMLMNLGSLVTIAAAAPPNLTLIVADNGVYEVTGAQATPGSVVNVDFEAMARACGFPATFRFSEGAAWARAIEQILGMTGPTFVALDVASVPGAPGPRSPGPAAARARALMHALSNPGMER